MIVSHANSHTRTLTHSSNHTNHMNSMNYTDHADHADHADHTDHTGHTGYSTHIRYNTIISNMILVMFYIIIYIL